MRFGMGYGAWTGGPRADGEGRGRPVTKATVDMDMDAAAPVVGGGCSMVAS